MTHIVGAIENGKSTRVVSILTWICVFLLFVGDVRIPIGGSELYAPLAIFPAIILFVIRIGFFELYFLRGSLALFGVLIAGLVTTAWSDYVSVARGVAAMFPIVTAIVVLLALNGVRDINRSIRSAVLVGGSFLALWVIFLSIQAFVSSLPFYEAKLLIETPLGRSNYLAAFLLAFLAFSWRQSLILKGVALISFCLLSIYSRGAFVVSVLFVLIVLYRDSRLSCKKYILGALVAVFLLGVLATISLVGLFEYDQVEEHFGFDPFLSAEIRLLLWKTSFDMLSESPLFGVGPNGFRSIVEVQGLEDVWGPHNSVLLLWLNYGILGVCFYLLYVFCIFQSVRKKKYNKFYDNNIFVLFCVLLIFSLFEPLVGSASFEILLAIVYLWGVGLRVNDEPRMLRSSGASLNPRCSERIIQSG